MKNNAQVTAILANIKRMRDGGVDEQTLIETLAKAITIDVAEEKMRRAKELINRQTKPNSTEAFGQIELPGIVVPYDYEPDRLIRDDLGKIIEQHRATPPYKRAEAQRASKHAEEAAFHSRIKNEEAGQFSQWAIDQIRSGRKQGITWKNFINETKIWKPGS